MRNPFIISGYVSPSYFCNRDDETKKIISAFQNNRNITLISLRRIGKTGLIHHTFHKLSVNKDYTVFYLDIQDTTSLVDFINVFAKSVLGKFDSLSTKIIENIGKIFGSLKPTISYDALTGQPKMNFEINNGDEAERSLGQIFDYLEKQKNKILIAIDEFQQILNYPEKNVEAQLRKHIQKTKNINFIFAGSHKHMLISMFKDHGRPFYQSTEILDLDTIDKNQYRKFIIRKFKTGGKEITESAVEYILDWGRVHTFYIQYICNRLYSLEEEELDLSKTNAVIESILVENRAVFNNYRNLLTKNQWSLLKAVAKEGKAAHITSAQFLNKYSLGPASSVKVALNVLLEKEMIYKYDKEYLVTDLFLSRWLEKIN